MDTRVESPKRTVGADRRRSRHAALQYAVATALIGLVIALGAWGWSSKREGPSAAHVILLLDASASIDQATRCADVHELGIALSRRGLGRLTVDVYATGASPSGGEPRYLGSAEADRALRMLERGGAPEELPFIGRLVELCNAVQPTSESPLWQAVRTVAQELGEDRCEGEGWCTLIVRTDGVELTDGAFVAELASPARVRREPRGPRERIENQHFDTHLCGLALRAAGLPGSKRPPITTLTDVWLSRFADPSRVSFALACTAELFGIEPMQGAPAAPAHHGKEE